MKEPNSAQHQFSGLNTYNVRIFISNSTLVLAILALVAAVIAFGVSGLSHTFAISIIATAALFITCYVSAPDLPY